MYSYGAEQFQEERESLIISLIGEACQLLIEEDVKIGARSVADKISFFFKIRELNKKMLVKEQSIARNPSYKKVWKNYQKKQKIPQRLNRLNNQEIDEISMRDQLDILQQEYIEILDERNFLKDINTKLQKKLDRLPLVSKSSYSRTSNNNDKNTFSPNMVLREINKFLQKGPVTIIKKHDEGSVIIKSRHNSNQERITFSTDDWVSIIEQ